MTTAKILKSTDSLPIAADKTPSVKRARKPRADSLTVKKTALKAKSAHDTSHHKAATDGAKALLADESVKTAQASPVRYIFSTGRRKTSVANIRLFPGNGDTLVNRKPIKKYFDYSFYLDSALQPFQVTGLGKDFYFTATVNGGGANSQAHAVRHGVAIALGKTSEAVRKVLKKNGLLTRDDRKKERKKPGLKRARRSPQWAKR